MKTMNPDWLLSHFNEITEALDAVPRLRRFILDLAVRGKLIQQDPKDEPASELLKRIQAEKARLVKEGEIRKQDQQAEIDATGIPFALPEHGAWARLGDVIRLVSGQHLQPSEYSDQQQGGPPYITGPADFGRNGLVITRYAVVRKAVANKGQILLTVKGAGVGKTAICDLPEVAISRQLMAITPIECSQPYLLLTTHRLAEALKETARSLIPGISREDVDQFVFPLPPLAEQHRIVAKVDELMALCDELEAAQQKRERRRDRLVAATLNGLNNGDASSETHERPGFEESARFYFNHLPRLTTRPKHIQQLRQTILNLAVRGKLVPQDPKDEPAAKLIARIQTERVQRTKEGKMGREPKLPPIDEASTPFVLPHGWAWARFPELGTFGRGKSKHRPRNDPSLFDGGTHLLVQTGDVAQSKGVIESFTSKYNDVGLAQSAMWPKGTLCVTIAANIADSGILGFDACFPDSVVGFIPASVFPNARYFEYFMRTAKADLLKFAPATAQKNINLGILNQVLIPLPPLAEQRRIVAKVDELMALCDELEAGLTTTATGRLQLLEATLQEALRH